MTTQFFSTAFAFASIALISACGGSELSHCPNDAPIPACNPAEACCAEFTTFDTCVRKNTPAVCDADGKTSGPQVEMLCGTEGRAYYKCMGVNPEGCYNFAAKELGFVEQPKDVDDNEATSGGIVRVKLKSLMSTAASYSTCVVLDSKGAEVLNSCSIWGLESDEAATNALPVGTYQIQVTAKQSGCADRSAVSNAFHVYPQAPVGSWKGTVTSAQSSREYSLSFKSEVEGTGSLDRVETKDVSAAEYPGCTITTFIIYDWVRNAGVLKFGSAFGTVKREGCMNSGDDLVSTALSPTERADLATKIGGPYTFGMTTKRTLNITAGEGLPPLELQ